MLLRDRIYDAIRRSILTCELEPGQELREQVLADQYNVSRSPTRDSLLRLAQEHLVTVLPRQGYQVRPILLADVEEIFQLRLLVEPACAAAATRADDEALQGLDRFRSYSAHNHREADRIEWHQAFHRAIADLSGNARMGALARELVEQSQRLVRFALHHTNRASARDVCAEHDSIIDALQARDADQASRLYREHIETLHEQALTLWRYCNQKEEMTDHAA